MEPLVKGHKIADRYTLAELLHTSEHGQVWLARDSALRSPVVLKIALGGNPVASALLRNEHAMSTRCIHPNVVRVFDFHDTDEHVFLVMEHLTEGRVGDLMGRPPAQFLPVMIELAESLAFVHKQNIVHRDFKLSNGMLDSHGHARLIDFGVASLVGDEGLRSGGSPRSMSPQQRAGELPNPADDLYAFGVALYRLTEQQWPDDNPLQRKATGTLLKLTDQLLEQDPAKRPDSMSSVVQSLRDVLAEQSNVTLPPDEFNSVSRVSGTQDSDAYDHIDVVEMDVQSAVPDDHGGGSKGRAIGLLAVYGLLGAVALFYFIPKFSDGREVSVAPVETATAVGTATATPGKSTQPPNETVEPWKLAQEAKLRKEAEAVLETLLERQFFLEDERAMVWAPDDFEQIKALAIQGDQAFRQNDFATALELYRQGSDIADRLTQASKTVLQETLDAASAQLAAANSVDATRLFQLALNIEPTSKAAQNGLERAGNLDQVLVLVAEAEALEQAGQVTEARDVFNRAVALDGLWQPAKSGKARMQRRLANSAYSRHMSAGFKALESGEFSASQEAFERAGNLRPGAEEVKQALAQLDTAIRLKEVNRLESRAVELERQGDLRGAQREYQALVETGSSTEAAANMRRVREHADVAQELTKLLAKPSRIANDSVFRNAQSVLERVDPYMSDPRISQQATQLRELMQVAKIPLPVELISDGETDILVYRIGRLGTLDRKSLNLRPGEYTVVGTRSGYRDVRVNFEVSPGQTVAPVEVICRERI